MQEVNTVTNIRHGKKKLPDERRRIILSTRVLPSTKTFLEGIGEETVGRAIDVIVRAIQRQEVCKLVDQRGIGAVSSFSGYVT